MADAGLWAVSKKGTGTALAPAQVMAFPMSGQYGAMTKTSSPGLKRVAANANRPLVAPADPRKGVLGRERAEGEAALGGRCYSGIFSIAVSEFALGVEGTEPGLHLHELWSVVKDIAFAKGITFERYTREVCDTT